MEIIIINKKLTAFLSGNFASAMALYPFILLSDASMLKNERLLNHERIHLRQQLELGILPFYLIYLLHYIWLRFKGWHKLEAYYGIRFEKEAYTYEKDLHYLRKRPPYACFRTKSLPN